MKSRYRNMYLKPNEPLIDTEVKLRQIIQIDGKYYAIIMIGVMWLSDINVLEPKEDRCVVAEVNPNNGELRGEMFNVILTIL